MRRSVFFSVLVTVVLLVSLVGPSDAGEVNTRYLHASDVKTLLPWISQNAIGRPSTALLLHRMLSATVIALKQRHVRPAPLPHLPGGSPHDILVFIHWLNRREASPVGRSLVLRQALRQMLTSLHEDGTRFYMPDTYMEPPEVEGYDKGGVGILVSDTPDSHGHFIIFETLDGFPCSDAGIRPGDRLVSVNGRSVVGMSYRQLADRVRGNLGTRVTLGILRRGTPAPLHFTLERVWLNPNPKNISWKVLDKHVGYIRIKFMGDRLNLEMMQAFAYFKREGVRQVILDLRNNEGLLTSSEGLGAVFLGDNREITRLVSNTGVAVERTHGLQATNLPTIVLVNRYTCPSGILLAGALRDYHAARVLGEATIWRDQPRVARTLPDGSTVRVTTGYYLLPGGEVLRTRSRSLRPDILVPQNPLDPLGTNSDRQLQKAVLLLSASPSNP